MRTQQELRDWIRSGMPVPGEPGEPERVIVLGCRVFVLRVHPDTGQIRTICSGCGGWCLEGVLKVGPNGIRVDGAYECLGKIAEWMVRHAIQDGMDPAYARKVYRSEAAWNGSLSWANELMRGKDASRWAGMKGPEAPGGESIEGFCLDAEPGRAEA